MTTPTRRLLRILPFAIAPLAILIWLLTLWVGSGEWTALTAARIGTALWWTISFFVLYRKASRELDTRTIADTPAWIPLSVYLTVWGVLVGIGLIACAPYEWPPVPLLGD